MLGGREEDHRVAAGRRDVVPPGGRGAGEVDDRPGRLDGRGLALVHLDRDRLRAVVAERIDPDVVVQHRVERDRVPRAVGEVPILVHGHPERGGDGREREGHQDPGRAGHERDVVGGLELPKDVGGLLAGQIEAGHDQLDHRRRAPRAEAFEDELPDLRAELVIGSHGLASLAAGPAVTLIRAWEAGVQSVEAPGEEPVLAAALDGQDE